ncbi:MAG: GWxTD domain-containing protein [Bacteroidetes bacterium]|nr:GWxTD domain-containing protein [Bacteroidota bacterium]
MKLSILKGIIAVMIIAAALPLKAQDENKFTEMLDSKDFFFVDPLVFYPYDSAVARLDLYVEIPLENLSFRRNTTTDNYDAVIEWVLLIKNAGGDVFLNQTFPEKITNTKTEQKSVAERSVSSLKNFYIHPGKYKITFTLRDKISNVEKSKDYDIEVKNPLYEKTLFSSIMLLSRYKVSESGEKEIEPLISGNVGMLDNFYMFWEARNRTEDTINRSYKISFATDKGEKIFDTTAAYTLKPGMNTLVTNINNDKYYIGTYVLSVYDGNDVIQSRTFTYRWSDIPANIRDLDKAISQMVYIATGEELDYIKAGKTKEERLKRFIKFWKQKDPTPGTPKNELLNIYYSRVKTATDRYSHFVEGWKTDMGMVYIIYGTPSTIDRHPFDADSKPYEIWTYYDEHRQFVFIDDSGFGDYRLVTPIYDDRTRIRY